MCWDCYDNKGGDPHKVFIQGGVEPSDFDEEIPYRHPKRRAKKARSKTRSPCPEAEDGKHVYVWVPYVSEYSTSDNIFYEVFGYHKHEVKVCCGCEVRGGRVREVERYSKAKERKWISLGGGADKVKRGEPISRWGSRYRSYYRFYWEDHNETYKAALRAEEEKRQAKREATAKANARMAAIMRKHGLLE